MEVRGLEHVPKKGPVLIFANHSGFAGADALLLAHVLKREVKRRARILAHRAYFDVSKSLKMLAEDFGLRKAGVTTGIEILKSGHVLIIFPEGEAGNFKSTMKRYHLETFHTGFLRMALQGQHGDGPVPLVPCLIVGSEESFLNLGNLDLGKIIKGLRIPFPVPMLPLPAKWIIEFQPPVVLPEGLSIEDKATLQATAHRMRRKFQRDLLELAKQRKFIFSRRLDRKVAKPLAKKIDTLSTRITNRLERLKKSLKG